MIKLDAKIPQGPLADKWNNYKSSLKLVSPANKKKLDIIVVGSGLSGASSASTQLLPRVESMQQKIIKTMVIAFTVCFTI